MAAGLLPWPAVRAVERHNGWPVQSAGDQTWDAICDVLELIDQHPDSAQARREEITGSNGTKMWKVPVRSLTVDDLVVLLSRGSAGDYVVFVGVMPIAR